MECRVASIVFESGTSRSSNNGVVGAVVVYSCQYFPRYDFQKYVQKGLSLYLIRRFHDLMKRCNVTVWLFDRKLSLLAQILRTD